MPLALGKAYDLVFYRRAITRTDALDLARVHRRAVEIGANQAVACLRRAGNEAAYLRHADFVCQEREWLRRIITLLRLKAGPIDGFSIKSRGGAGLQSAHGKADPMQRLRQPDCRRLVDAPPRSGFKSTMHHPG